MASNLTATKEFLFKFIVVGDSGAGKTSLVRRFVENKFAADYRHTIGVDFALKVLDWDEGSLLRLQLWDIAGQERYGMMTRVYYRDSHACAVVFDATERRSFEAVVKWKEDLDSKVRLADGSPIPAILLANKWDMDPAPLPEDLSEYAERLGFVGSFVVSAKDGLNVESAFRFLARYVFDQSMAPAAPSTGEGLQLGSGGGSGGSGSDASEAGSSGRRGCCGRS